MRLAVKERILLHLLEYVRSAEDAQVPPEMTREGVARASWIDVRHVPQNTRPLVRDGLVVERTSHVTGGARRRKAYFLTDSGRKTAVHLREMVKAELVKVHDPTGARTSTFADILRETGGRVSLLELVRQSIQAGVVDLSSSAAVRVTAMEAIPPRAVQLEGDYDWLGAAGVYEGALASSAPSGVRSQGPLRERLAHALFKGAMQANNPNDSRRHLKEALKNCEKAREAYSKAGYPENSAWVLRCVATAAYLTSWLAGGIEERRKELDKAWDSCKRALDGFDQEGQASEHAETYCRLSLVPILRYYMEWDARLEEPALRDSIRRGERAIATLETSGDSRRLAEAWVATARDLDTFATYLASLSERDGLYARAEDYWRKAVETSEEGAMLALPLCRSFWGDGTDEALAATRRALGYARKANDHLALGCLLRMLAYHMEWKSEVTEDLGEWKQLLAGALEAANEAKREFACIGFVDFRGGAFSVETAQAEYSYWLSLREPDSRKRHELLRRATETGREGIQRAASHGYPNPVAEGLFALAYALVDMGTLETHPEAKKTILEEALARIDELDRLEARCAPSMFFNRGQTKMARAYAKSQLASFVRDTGAQVRMLTEAVQDEEDGLALLSRYMQFQRRRGEVSGLNQLGVDQSKCADLLTHLYELTGDRGYLRKSAEMLDRALESFRRPDVPSRIAEGQWKAAKIYASLEDHLRAADEFSLACHTYQIASDRVPQLREFYQDLALYMQAWSEIERARHYHDREEYREARDYYERAAALHGFSKRWRFMAPNYAAWVQVERAEDLSRAEMGTEAVAAFRQAGGLFREAQDSLEAALKRIQDIDERRMVQALVQAGERRSQYCAARIAVEEAKILHKNGENDPSSRKYGQAANGLEKLAAEAESDRDRRDLSLIATLAKAWEAMTKAEAGGSPELYAEAARFFEAARELSSGEKPKALAWGHSRFCMALEAGTKFADNRDPALYASAIKHLDSAASHYARAGAVKDSEYTQASKLLFDAYAAMDRAGQETDPEKKAKGYLAVEKILETSAAAFGKADLPGKREETLRLLGNVRRQRELAISLMETLQAPLSVSSTAAFAAPAPSYEQAVGIARLEHADIRASLISPAKAIAVGEDLSLKLELVNAGRAAGLLIKVEELVPKGFKLVAGPDTVEEAEGFLTLKGRRLEPLKTEVVEVVLRPMAEGVFLLKPRIMYLDEAGNYKAHDPEPVEVKVAQRTPARSRPRRGR